MSQLINSTHYPMLEEKIVKADGIFVYNEDHKKFYDLESGVWCLPLGHNHKAVNQAMIDQLNSISHVGYLYSNHIIDDAAAKLSLLSGIKDSSCVFLSSGSEAVEYAIQVAKSLHPNKKGARLKQAYLSAYGFARYSSKDWIELDQSLEDINFDDIGYLVLELGNHSGLVKTHQEAWIKHICDQVQKHQGIVIIDEVTTGIGRTGKWFGYMHFDISPDMIACGKGLGNGYPVSAVVIKTDLINQAIKNGFGYAQSHQNDPMGARIALSVLSEVESLDLVRLSALKGAYFKEKLLNISQQTPLIKEVRGIGLMIAIEFVDTVSIEILKNLHHYMHEKGYLLQVLPTRKVLRLYPPLIIAYDDIDVISSAILNGLNHILIKTKDSSLCES